jgi:enediyne biosynthesis protein E4
MNHSETPQNLRPGSDWLRPEATIGTRVRSNRQRIALVLTSTALLAAGIGVFYATGSTPRSSEPLSFFLEEKLPEDTGIRFQHHMGAFAPFFDNVKPFMQAVSASACTADIDRDGDLDLFFTDAGENEKNSLFLNDGNFKFHRAEIPALDGKNGRDGFSADCAFGDVDNDGFPDLFVGTVAQRPHLFRNVMGKEFVEISDEAGIPDYMNGFASTFFDADHDGDLDLLYASYFSETYQKEDIEAQPRIHNFVIPDDENAGRMMPNNWGNATNGGQKHFLLNDGSGKFVAQDLAEWGFTDTRFTFDIGTADINLDGFTDIYFANDFGPDQMYLSEGGKRFVELKGNLPTEVGHDPFKGMNAEIADINNDGYPEIYVTNVFHPVLPEGNVLWMNEGGKTFKNVAADLGAKDGGWGWGAKFVDLDLDTDVDLVATNGYISQNEKKDYWYRLSRLVSGDRRLIVDTRKWPNFDDRSMSGHQVSHVFVWDGYRFHNRAADVGVTRKFDGRGVVIADFDVDGRPDVLYVAQGAPYFLGRNVFRPTEAQPNQPNWIGLRLQGDGTRVNRDAVGVRVEVVNVARASAPASRTYREISVGNGMSSQSMQWVLVGLGDQKEPVDVVVHWTDGTKTNLNALEPNRYHDIQYGQKTAMVTP